MIRGMAFGVFPDLAYYAGHYITLLVKICIVNLRLVV